MKILLIGGCGYIGSALYGYLQERGHDLTVVDLEWFGKYINCESHRVDFSTLDEAELDLYQTVILLAGHSSVGMCCQDLLSAFNNNVRAFVTLLSRLRHQRFIYASSSSVYGNVGDSEVNEDERLSNPLTAYDLSKSEIDRWARLSPVECYGLRFGTVNGASPNLRIDIMMNQMCYQAATEGKICVANRHIFRPILGMTDLCRAVVAIIDDPVDRRGVYNLASFNIQVGELALELASHLNVPLSMKPSTPAYNFTISTNKFQDCYKFCFRDSIKSIAASLQRVQPTYGVRNVSVPVR
jgi:UDP-glucose 4-epimerase